MVKISPFRTFNECLVEWLEDAENAQAYLYVVLEEYARGQNLKAFLRSLNNIVTVQGDKDKKLKVCWHAMGTFVETFNFSFAALSLDQLPA